MPGEAKDLEMHPECIPMPKYTLIKKILFITKMNYIYLNQTVTVGV